MPQITVTYDACFQCLFSRNKSNSSSVWKEDKSKREKIMHGREKFKTTGRNMKITFTLQKQLWMGREWCKTLNKYTKNKPVASWNVNNDNLIAHVSYYERYNKFVSLLSPYWKKNKKLFYKIVTQFLMRIKQEEEKATTILKFLSKGWVFFFFLIFVLTVISVDNYYSTKPGHSWKKTCSGGKRDR